MKNITVFFLLMGFGAGMTVAQNPVLPVGDPTDWFFHYDQAVAYESKKKHGKAYKSLRKAAELAIETLNDAKMLERLLADQNGKLRYLAAGPKNHEWGHIRKALESHDAKWLKLEVYQDPFDEQGGHRH